MAYPSTYRLVFLLPASVRVRAQQRDCPTGCKITVAWNGWVSISGPSWERVKEQTAAFLRVEARGRTFDRAATLISPCGARDPWTIVVNASVSFAPTGLGVDLPTGDAA